MRELDLQPTFPRLRAFAEDFQNERGAVQHLGIPRFLQIALLHGGKLSIDDDDFRLERARFGGDLLDLAGTDQRAWRSPSEGNDGGSNDLQSDGGGQADRFIEAGLRIAQLETRALLALDVDDERADALLFGDLKPCLAQAFSIAGAVSCSINWIGPSGITVEMACL